MMIWRWKKDAIQRVRGVFEPEVEGQKTLYDLLGWGQEVGKADGE